MISQSCLHGKIPAYLTGAALLSALYLTSRYNYLLFHSLVELFSVAIAGGIFMIAWNSRRFIANNYLVFIGMSYVFLGTIDLFHTLAYKNMGVFPGINANQPTQLWIAGRYLHSCSLLAAPLFLNRSLNIRLVLAGFTAVTLLLLLSIFSWGVFPDCFVEGAGLTLFKKSSEYINVLLLAASLLFMLSKRRSFHRDVMHLLAASIVLLMLAELSFTLYTDVFGISNMIGHLFKATAYYLIYKAMIETGLSRPFDLLFRELQQSNDQLELRVKERTVELNNTITLLQDENIERELTEEELRVAVEELRQSKEMIERLNRLYALLSATNQAIVHTQDRDSLFREFCRAAVEHGGFRLAWVGLVDSESGLVDIMAAHGTTGYLDDIRISVREEADGLGPTGIAVRDGTYHICNDLHNSRITRLRHEQARVHGLFSSASVAVKQNNQVIGSLTLYAEKRDFFDQQQVELLLQMGADISFALDNIVRETLCQEADRALREETIERLLAVEALRDKEQMLVQQSRQAAMGEMIGNIAHQWRQPLNALGLYTQGLGFFYGQPIFNKEFLDTSIAKSMEIIQHMSKTIDDFRNYFKPDKERCDFNVSESINKALSLLEGSFQGPMISIESVELDNPVINGFQNEFAQVLLNILVNARDAVIEREIADAKVIITICREDGSAVVTISDNAGGIPEEIIDKVFDPYFTTKGSHQGTGVGLFMSKTIIEKNMGGKLSVRNNDTGAEFRIEVADGARS